MIAYYVPRNTSTRAFCFHSCGWKNCLQSQLIPSTSKFVAFIRYQRRLKRQLKTSTDNIKGKIAQLVLLLT